MKKVALFLCTALIYIGAVTAGDKASSLQEGVELRRISAYFKERNYAAVKAQSHNFLTKYPHSHSTDALHAMLGDIAFMEGDYTTALQMYDQIQKREIKAKTEFRRIHCLHRLSHYDALIPATHALLKSGELLEGQRPTLRLQLAHALLQTALKSDEAESKRKLLLQAKEHYLSLAPTDYAPLALLPLAQTHTLLKEYAQAVKLYAALIEKEPQNKEEYLLQIMELQCRYDRPSAIDTCEKIVTLAGPSAPRAAYNQLCLLFQEKRFADLAHFQEKAFAALSSEKQTLAHYFIGRSLYHIGDYKTAIPHLEAFLQAPSIQSAQRKTALLTLLHCAKQNENMSLFENTLRELKTAFPQEEETLKALVMHAQFCMSKGGDVSLALENLQQLLEDPDLPQRADILYQYALLCAQAQKWFECSTRLESFTKSYPAHAHQDSAWRHLIQARLNYVKQASSEASFAAKDTLAQTLASALKREGLFSAEEKRKMRLFCAKLLLELDKPQCALEELTSYETEYPADPEKAQIYVLIALAHLRMSSDPDLFIHYAEKALKIDPEYKDASTLHLTLYNTYLNVAERKGDEEKEEILLKAADHLYSARTGVQRKENILWLAQFYTTRYKAAKTPLFLDRAIVILEKIVKETEEPVQREAERLRLAELYGAKQQRELQLALLQTMAEEYTQHPDIAWKYQRLALFELAEAYKGEKQVEKAIETYSSLIASSACAPSYFATAAQLEKVLLQLSLLPSEKRETDSGELQALCDELKDLQTKRKLFSEPCHLEAALTYVDIVGELSPLEKRTERRLFLLQQVKESFSSSEDPLVKEYLAAKEEFASEYALYQHYMTLLDVDLCTLEAEIACAKQESEKGLALKHKAEEKLQQIPEAILQGRLKQRALKSKEQLAKIL